MKNETIQLDTKNGTNKILAFFNQIHFNKVLTASLSQATILPLETWWQRQYRGSFGSSSLSSSSVLKSTICSIGAADLRLRDLRADIVPFVDTPKPVTFLKSFKIMQLENTNANIRH